MEASFLRAFLGLEETSCSTLFTIPVSKPSTEIQLGAIPCSSDMSTLDVNIPNHTNLKRSSLWGSNSQLTTDLWISCRDGEICVNQDFTIPFLSLLKAIVRFQNNRDSKTQS